MEIEFIPVLVINSAGNTEKGFTDPETFDTRSLNLEWLRILSKARFTRRISVNGMNHEKAIERL